MGTGSDAVKAPSTAGNGYFPALDGVRTMCCAWVVVGHAVPISPYSGLVAGMGVNVFFALSGFLITTLLLRERARTGSIALGPFYLRRVLRIFPVYYAALAVFVAGTLLLGDRFLKVLAFESPVPWGPILGSHATFLANWYDDHLPTSLSVLWSVSVEEQFYVVFPPLLVLAGRNRSAYGVVVFGLAAAWATRLYLAFTTPHLVYRNSIAHGDHLLLGVALAQAFHTNTSDVEAFCRRLGTAGEVVTIAVLVALPYWEFRVQPVGVQLFFYYVVSAIACALLVALVATMAGAFSRVFAWSPVRVLGQLTYSAYVFHIYGVTVAWAVCQRFVAGGTLELAARAALSLVFTFVLAYVVRVTFEARILAFKDRIAGPRPAAHGGVARDVSQSLVSGR
ncbi:MAG: acyltransferase [Polyangiaceae bacterium]